MRSASTRSASSEPELAAVRRRPDRGQPAGRQGRRARRPAGRLDRPAVLLRLGSEHPRRELQDQPDTEINGGQQPITGLYKAVKQASKCDDVAGRRRRTAQAAAGAALLRLRQGLQEAVQQRAAVRLARGRARRLDAAEQRAAPRSSRSRPACSSCATQKAERRRRRRRTAGGSSRTARASRARTSRTRSRTSTSTAGNEPIVTFDFTDKGRKAFQDDHARRSPSAAPTTRSRRRTRSTTSQHFAIALDNELVSAPYINYRENPDGIDGSTGAQISGGFTIQTRPGPGEDPQDRRAAAEARAESRARRSPRRSASRRSTRA